MTAQELWKRYFVETAKQTGKSRRKKLKQGLPKSFLTSEALISRPFGPHFGPENLSFYIKHSILLLKAAEQEFGITGSAG